TRGLEPPRRVAVLRRLSIVLPIECTPGSRGRCGSAILTRRDVVLWRTVVDELANGLQVAIGFAAQVRRSSQTTADDAVRLEASIARAVAVLKRLQPTATSKRTRR